jgi:hypothetical protein
MPGVPTSTLQLLLQRRNAPAQFVYGIIEMTDCILQAINSSIQVSISALTGRKCPYISHDSFIGPAFFARICRCHDAPRPLCPDKLRPVTASLGSGALDDPLQLSKNIRCFSNAPRLCSNACSSDSAISEGWPVSSAYLTISRWRAVWTANSAICRLACARCAKRNQARAKPSRVARAFSS